MKTQIQTQTQMKIPFIGKAIQKDINDDDDDDDTGRTWLVYSGVSQHSPNHSHFLSIHTHTPMHTDIAILCNAYGDKAHQHQHDIKHNQMVRIKDHVGNRMNR